MSDQPTTVLDGLAFADGLRWHDGRLWLCDVHAGVVLSVAEDGDTKVEAELPGRPAGIGFLPDGRPLVTSARDRRLYRLEAGGPVVHADLSPMIPHDLHGIAVTAGGRAYVGNVGFDLEGGAEPASTTLACVEPDGSAWIAVERLLFPNGIVLTEGDATLLVVETFANRVSAYDVGPDGGLADPRTWADLRPNVPAGGCRDAQGALWVADPINQGLMRVEQHRGATSWIPMTQSPYDCVLGGEDGRTLLVATSTSSDPDRTLDARPGRIVAVRVDVPGPPD